MTNLRTVSSERLPPDDEKVADIFARLGYKIEDAIADLVDNSIDANADQVHVRFIKSPKGIHTVVIADNGDGMTSAELSEAMRFGSRTSKSGKQLGKYGIGLKSASLSQADVVSVLSRRDEVVSGRRWSLQNVKSGWNCDVLNMDDVRARLDDDFGRFRIDRSGTIVLWDRLEHLQALPDTVDSVLEKTTKTLQIELGIRFHRFIERERLTITIDQQMLGDSPTGLPLVVRPLNPFSYERPPLPQYPVSLDVTVAQSRVRLECHIWPPKSNAPGYRLGGGKVALRQGFYFYRNDRLIQAGGWNGVRADDSEPHSSLARVRVELPDSLDSLFKLEVTKMGLHPTPEFMQAILTAKSRSGVTFDNYQSDALAVYRKKKKEESAKFLVRPGDGLSKNAQKAIALILQEPGAPKPEVVRFRWSRLDVDELFRVFPGKPLIFLNTRYKRQLAEGGSDDAPVLKVMLMFLVQERLRKQFATQVSEKWTQTVNQALIAALKA